MNPGSASADAKFATPPDETTKQFVNVAELPSANATRIEYVPGGKAPAVSVAVICVNESTEIELAG
jgi:hypothetical protein